MTNYELRLTQVLRYELQLIPSCGWLRVAADSILQLTQVPPAELDLRLTYTLIYQINLRTYSAKFIIFMVCFLPLDSCYHWFRLWLLVQTLKKLEEVWRSSKTLTATDSSCSNWFELQQLIWDLRPIDCFQKLWSWCSLVLSACVAAAALVARMSAFTVLLFIIFYHFYSVKDLGLDYLHLS